MTFTLPRYVKPATAGIENAEFVKDLGNDAEYRCDDFDGLSEHDKLLRKLAILTARGRYFLE